MATIRAALVQTTWTGDKESMIKAHEEYARQAAEQGARSSASRSCSTGRTSVRCRTPSSTSTRRRSRGRRPSGSRRWRGARARDGAADVRAGAAGRVVQHRGGRRRGRLVPRQVPEDPHPAGEGVLGEVLLPARQPRVPGVRDRGRPRRRVHLLRPALPGGLARARPQRRRDRVQPVGDVEGVCRRTCGSSSSPPSAVANEYYIGAINRVGIEDLGDNDFYGTSYFVDPGRQVRR